MARKLSNAEQAVVARRNADALYSSLTAEERAEYTQGLRWAETLGQVYTGQKLRGRPPGSKNRAAEVEQDKLSLAESAAAISEEA